uniref:Large polyvalent protein associated domain-containing protein n=1 Tax=viral metagenome TaxID=1070528 RepID=A0A6M3KF92_9ZZZZ
MAYIPPWLRQTKQVQTEERPPVATPAQIPQGYTGTSWQQTPTTWEQPQEARPWENVGQWWEQTKQGISQYMQETGIGLPEEYKTALMEAENEPNLISKIAKSAALTGGAITRPLTDPMKAMEVIAQIDKPWGEMISKPFRKQDETYKEYSEREPLISMAMELSNPIMWIAPGGKAKKGANILEDVIVLLKKGENPETIRKVLTETTQAGRKLLSKEADDLLETAQKAVGGTTKGAEALPGEAQRASTMAWSELEKTQSIFNELAVGVEKITPEVETKFLKTFGEILASPTTEKARLLTMEARKAVLAKRFEAFQLKAEELIGNGLNTEEAIRKATKEMAGKLPDIGTTLFDDISNQMRDVLFSKLYRTLKDNPAEILSTSEALRDALLGRSIPRIPGTTGQSAHTRLMRVFRDDPEIMKVLENQKPLKQTVEEIFYGIKPEEINQEIADYLRKLPTKPFGQARLGEKGFSQISIEDLRTIEQKRIAQWELERSVRNAANEGKPFEFTKETEGTIGKLSDKEAKLIRMLPKQQQHALIRALKEAGLSIIDIGNFVRANKASVDFSFWRQQAPLIIRHPLSFAKANREAFLALFSDAKARVEWNKIVKDPLYGIYDELGLDFIRPLIPEKGIPQYKLTEEFGYLGANRPISQLTEKVPWIKVSARSFITGTNVHNWAIFKDFYTMLLKENEKIATGAMKLKPGEVFSMKNELLRFGKMLESLTGRESLGKASAIAPILSAGLFAPRMLFARFFSAKHLFSPSKYVRSEAWKTLGSFVGITSSILLLGKQMGWWDVDTDKTSSDFMKIRVGNTRIDPWGGYQQAAVFTSRIIDNTLKGQEGDFRFLPRFIRSKFAPLTSILAEIATRKTFLGEDIDIKNPKQWANWLAPFATVDIHEAFEDHWVIGAATALPAIIGAGIQTYADDLDIKNNLIGQMDDNGKLYTVSNFFGDISRKSHLTTVEKKLPLVQLHSQYISARNTYLGLAVGDKRKEWRLKNPREEAIMFIGGYFDVVSSSRSEQYVDNLKKQYGITDSMIRQSNKPSTDKFNPLKSGNKFNPFK